MKNIKRTFLIANMMKAKSKVNVAYIMFTLYNIYSHEVLEDKIVQLYNCISHINNNYMRYLLLYNCFTHLLQMMEGLCS